MSSIVQDVRYGLRLLSKNLGLTVTAVITLSLGIGANVTIFAFLNGLFFGNMPFPDSDRTVYLWSTDRLRGQDRLGVSLADFVDWRDNAEAFEALAAFQTRSFNLSGDRPEKLTGLAVSSSFFDIVGARAAHGRTFDASDKKVVVLSHKLWLERFDGKDDIVGRTVRLDREAYTVMGVMPPAFWFPSLRIQLWVPLELDGTGLDRRTGTATVFGLLEDSATVDEARAEMETLASRLEQVHSDTNEGRGVNVTPVSWGLMERGDRMMMALLMLTVLPVLLIACVNVANVLLASTLARREELAIRAALGAGRIRLARQLLVEASLLALLAAGGGLLAAHWGARALTALIAASTPIPENLVDGRVLGFTAAISLLAVLIFGFASALSAFKASVIRPTGVGVGLSKRRIVKIMVMSETGLALALLLVSVVMIRTMTNLSTLDTGFTVDDVLVARMELPQAYYSTPRHVTSFYHQLLENIRGRGRVASLCAASHVPFEWGAPSLDFSIEGSPTEEAVRPRALRVVITPDYFSSLDIDILMGRDFTEADAAETLPVVIVNQALVRRHWPDEDPLGKRLAFHDADPPRWTTIVGVAADVRRVHPAFEPRPQVYVPFSQNPSRSMTLAVRASGDLSGVSEAVREEVRRLDADLPVYNVKELWELAHELLQLPKTIVGVLVTFTILAAVLATVGVYGVVSCSVRQRTREIGLRMALGAGKNRVLTMIIREGMRLASAGLVFGTLLGLGLARVISSQFIGISGNAPATYVGAVLLLGGAAFLATYIPARLAARVDAAETLRYE